MKRCIIVSAGPVGPKMQAKAAQQIFASDFVIACDAGWRRCESIGLVPNLVVGDFDSAPQPPQARKQIVLPHVKDDTDTQYAARQAVEHGFDTVWMLGALGGRRMEHTLANLGTALWLAKRGVSVVLESEESRVSIVTPQKPGIYPKGGYQYLSVFPMEGKAEGVDIKGVYYPLQGAALAASYPIGVSNEITETQAEICVKNGFLLVVETVCDT